MFGTLIVIIVGAGIAATVLDVVTRRPRPLVGPPAIETINELAKAAGR